MIHASGALRSHSEHRIVYRMYSTRLVSPRRSAPRHLPQMLGITGPLHGDVGERGVDFAKIIGVKVDSGSSDVFF